MKKFIFISGGSRSGKSRLAVESAKKLAGPTVFIATAEALDGEMKERIRKHREERPKDWALIEESRNIHQILSEIKDRYNTLIIDCMGLLVSNLMADGMSDAEIIDRIKNMFTSLRKSDLTLILVSNEAGMGIVPDNALARRFGDLLGSANQISAEIADEVILMCSGIPVYIKGGGLNAKTKENTV